MQRFVGGYIEAIYPFTEEVAIVCNEEGKIDGLPLNRALYFDIADKSEPHEIYDIIAGKAFICGLGESTFESLSKEDLQRFQKMFEKPELFIKENDTIKAVEVEEKTYNHAMRHR